MSGTEELRAALRQIESDAQTTLAHQPEDDGKCRQMLYDALVRIHNAADAACTAHRTREEEHPCT